MEVVQLKKGGKVKRRRAKAKAKQPLQTQRQTVNIRMGGGGGGAMIGSTHTFSQPPMFYNAIREIPNTPVNYGDNPIRGQIPNADPVSGTSVVSNPQTMAPIPLNPNKTPQPLNTPVRLFAPRGYIPRRQIAPSPQRSPSTAKSVFAEHTDDIYPAPPLARAEPHDTYNISEQGAVAATASSSASASGMEAQLVKPLSNPRGRPRKEAGAPTAPYNKSEGYIPPKYRPTQGGQ
jgi:hypothetical protein